MKLALVQFSARAVYYNHLGDLLKPVIAWVPAQTN